MATVLPPSRNDLIDWFIARIASWGAAPTEIGLSAAQIATLSTLLSAADDARSSTIATRIAARDATIDFHNTTDELRSFGADLVKTIKAFAETNNDPGVYSAASVPPPAPPTPAGPPDEPTELDADILNPFGISLKWKGSVAQGAYFGVWRRLSGESTFTFLKTTKTKSFQDLSLPASVEGVSYYIAAYRDDFQVNSSTLSIQFGAGGQTSMSLAA